MNLYVRDIIAMREMIVAETKKARETALAKLLPMQKKDFAEIFRIMDGLPVTIRLLDPPLHEFLPHTDEEIAEVAASMGADAAKLKARALELQEANPMLGFRGVRIAIAGERAAGFAARLRSISRRAGCPGGNSFRAIACAAA